MDNRITPKWSTDLKEKRDKYNEKKQEIISYIDAISKSVKDDKRNKDNFGNTTYIRNVKPDSLLFVLGEIKNYIRRVDNETTT
jgi:hypothetical protein